MSTASLTPSAYRNSVLADRARADIFRICMEHAGVHEPTCALCGATGVPLEVNHVFKRTWVQRALCRYRRMLRCRKEALAGEINLLCRSCNATYRPVEPWTYARDEPF